MSLSTETCEPYQTTIFDALDGSTSSQEGFRASRGASPGSAKAPTTSATCGPTSSPSDYASAQRRFWSRMSLASRAILEDLTGSPATLSGRATSGGRAVCVLRTSAPRTFATGCSSALSTWSTPDASVMNDGESWDSFEARRARLKVTAQNGNGAGTPLAIMAQTAPRPTSRASDGEKGGPNQRGSKGDLTLPSASLLVDWPTPAARDHKGDGGPPLTYNARPLNEVARWATPQSSETGRARDMDRRERDGRQMSVEDQVHGLTPPPSSAATASTASYRLNWRFSQWLMGLPAGWLDSELWAMPSSRFKPTSPPAPSTKP